MKDEMYTQRSRANNDKSNSSSEFFAYRPKYKFVPHRRFSKYNINHFHLANNNNNFCYAVFVYSLLNYYTLSLEASLNYKNNLSVTDLYETQLNVELNRFRGLRNLEEQTKKHCVSNV